MLKRIAIAAMTLALTACAWAGGPNMKEPPGGDWKQVSTLVKLPAFIPDLGSLYVKPSTLPVGPFLAYDHDHKLVSTIYMVPLSKLDAHEKVDDLPVGDNTVKETELYFNAGHPGVEVPHYHVILWHVDPDDAKLK